MLLQVIHLERDAIPCPASNLVPGGEKRVVVVLEMVELVMKVSPAIFRPLAFQRSRSNSNLVRGCANDRIDIDEIGILGNIVVAAIHRAIAFQQRHQLLFFETVFAPLVLVGELIVCPIPDLRNNTVVEEGAILNHANVADRVLETPADGFHRELQWTLLPRLHGLVHLVDPVPQAFIVRLQPGARKIDACLEVARVGQREMDLS